MTVKGKDTQKTGQNQRRMGRRGDGEIEAKRRFRFCGKGRKDKRQKKQEGRGAISCVLGL
jgi:hypothetical protein